MLSQDAQHTLRLLNASVIACIQEGTATRRARHRQRYTCDRRGILIAACVLVFLVAFSLSTWALVEALHGLDQVTTFWAIEDGIRNQVRAERHALCDCR